MMSRSMALGRLGGISPIHERVLYPSHRPGGGVTFLRGRFLLTAPLFAFWTPLGYSGAGIYDGKGAGGEVSFPHPIPSPSCVRKVYRRRSSLAGRSRRATTPFGVVGYIKPWNTVLYNLCGLQAVGSHRPAACSRGAAGMLPLRKPSTSPPPLSVQNRLLVQDFPAFDRGGFWFSANTFESELTFGAKPA